MAELRQSCHPSAHQLSDFSLGKLDDVEVEAIANHLEGCPDCLAAAQSVPPDAFLGQLVATHGSAGGAPARDPSAPPRQGQDLTDTGRAGITSCFASPVAGPGSGTIPTTDVPAALAEHPKFRIVRKLGEGGMGTVYLAEHLLMKRQVAIKVVSQTLVANDAALARFRQEIEAAAQLDHVNIVRAFDAEEVDGLHLLVMEYVDGCSLQRLVTEKGAMGLVEACRYMWQAAQGLQHAHDKAMVHRDIKPRNLIVPPQGQVKIMDFGLARLAWEQLRHQGRTPLGIFMGTPEYVAPEQAVEARDADIRADIYSLGCTFYYLLAGRPS